MDGLSQRQMKRTLELERHAKERNWTQAWTNLLWPWPGWERLSSSSSNYIVHQQSMLQQQQQQQLQQHYQQQQFQRQQLEMMERVMNTPRPEVRPQLLITPYKDGKDIKDFLETFESMMWVQNIDEEQWVLQLIPLLKAAQ